MIYQLRNTSPLPFPDKKIFMYTQKLFESFPNPCQRIESEKTFHLYRGTNRVMSTLPPLSPPPFLSSIPNDTWKRYRNMIQVKPGCNDALLQQCRWQCRFRRSPRFHRGSRAAATPPRNQPETSFRAGDHVQWRFQPMTKIRTSAYAVRCRVPSDHRHPGGARTYNDNSGQALFEHRIVDGLPIVKRQFSRETWGRRDRGPARPQIPPKFSSTPRGLREKERGREGEKRRKKGQR